MRVKTGATWRDLGPRSADDWSVAAGEGLLGAGMETNAGTLASPTRVVTSIFRQVPGLVGAHTHQMPADGLDPNRTDELE